MKTSTYLGEAPVTDKGHVELHECPGCGGLFGIDVTFLEQVEDDVHCMMCSDYIHIEEVA